MELSREQKIILNNKFFSDPDFYLIYELLSKNTDKLRDINTIDITQSAETIKAQIAGRQETLKLVDNFKKDIEVVKNINNNNISFK